MKEFPFINFQVKTWTNFEDGQDITPDNLLAIFVQVKIFPVFIRNRLISGGLEPVAIRKNYV